MNIRYLTSLENITEDRLKGGFFEDWPNPPGPANFLRLLHGSDYVILAENQTNGQIVGFVTALSDGVLSAYIPLLEVVPSYRGHGIGQELIRRMLERLNGHYMIDLLCDAELEGFYTKIGMHPAGGMILRNYQNQSGML